MANESQPSDELLLPFCWTGTLLAALAYLTCATAVSTEVVAMVSAVGSVINLVLCTLARRSRQRRISLGAGVKSLSTIGIAVALIGYVSAGPAGAFLVLFFTWLAITARIWMTRHQTG